MAGVGYRDYCLDPCTPSRAAAGVAPLAPTTQVLSGNPFAALTYSHEGFVGTYHRAPVLRRTAGNFIHCATEIYANSNSNNDVSVFAGGVKTSRDGGKSWGPFTTTYVDSTATAAHQSTTRFLTFPALVYCAANNTMFAAFVRGTRNGNKFTTFKDVPPEPPIDPTSTAGQIALSNVGL